MKQGDSEYPEKWIGTCDYEGSHVNKGDQKIELFIAGGKSKYFSAKRIEFFGFDSFGFA